MFGNILRPAPFLDARQDDGVDHRGVGVGKRAGILRGVRGNEKGWFENGGTTNINKQVNVPVIQCG